MSVRGVGQRDFPNISSCRIFHIDELVSRRCTEISGSSVRVLGRYASVDATSRSRPGRVGGLYLYFGTDRIGVPLSFVPFVGNAA